MDEGIVRNIMAEDVSYLIAINIQSVNGKLCFLRVYELKRAELIWKRKRNSKLINKVSFNVSKKLTVCSC